MAVRRSIDDDRVAPEQTLRQTIAIATRASSGRSARPFSEHPLLLLALWVVGTALSWRFVAAHAAGRLIGLDPSGISYGGIVLTAAFVLPAAVLTFRALRRALIERRVRDLDPVARTEALERRQVLATGVAATYAEPHFAGCSPTPTSAASSSRFSKPEHVDEYLFASGGKLDKHDVPTAASPAPRHADRIARSTSRFASACSARIGCSNSPRLPLRAWRG